MIEDSFIESHVVRESGKNVAARFFAIFALLAVIVAINIFGVADYLMTKMFGKYDAGSHNIAYIYTDLLKGLSEILLTKTQRTEESTPLKNDMEAKT